MIHMDGERLNDGADHLREDGYLVSYDQTHWTLFHGTDNRFVGGENLVPGNRTADENLVKAIIKGETDKRRRDHLKSFAVEGFKPEHDGLLLHMPTGLLGYAEEMSSGLFRFCCENEGVQTILCKADEFAPAQETMKAFEAIWTFICDGEQYGEVNARVVGGNAEQAKATAQAATETFKYDDERIKDRRSAMSIEKSGEFLTYDESYEALTNTLGRLLAD